MSMYSMNSNIPIEFVFNSIFFFKKHTHTIKDNQLPLYIKKYGIYNKKVKDIGAFRIF